MTLITVKLFDFKNRNVFSNFFALFVDLFTSGIEDRSHVFSYEA